MKVFNAARFSLARKRRGLRKRELAEKVGVSERSITAYEKGEHHPESATLLRIAEALNFPEEFFFADDPEELIPETASFRSMSKMTSRQRDMALSSGTIALSLNEWIEARFNLPKNSLINFGQDHIYKINKMEGSENLSDTEYPPIIAAREPEAAAESLRSLWGLGELPIKNMIALLESNGIRVYSLALDSKEVDAFSMWHGGTPFVFLNTYKSAEHCRFDAAHELGHLVLHKHGASQGPELEREANAFASAFLMPRKSVLARGFKNITLKSLVLHKKYWNVSVAALNYRLHALGITSDWIYRTLCIQLAEHGYRTNEPDPSTHEKSQILEKVFSALRAEGVTRKNVADELLIPIDEINSATFGLMLNVLYGEGSRRTDKKANLSLVK